MLDPGGIRGAKCCVNKNGAVILTPTRLLPFNRCDFAERLHDCDARVVHQQIERILSNLSDEIGNAGRDSEIVDQANDVRTVWFQGLAHIRQSNGVSPVEK